MNNDRTNLPLPSGTVRFDDGDINHERKSMEDTTTPVTPATESGETQTPQTEVITPETQPA